MNNLTGGCICGNLRYKLSGEPKSKALCHCNTCHHLSGSAFTTNLVYLASDVKLTKGIQKTYTAVQDSGAHFTFSFCQNCGCTVYKTSDGEGLKGVVIVQAGSLDEPEALEKAEPDAELWVSKRLGWLKPMEGKAQQRQF